jgi:ClpP class serine protease
MKFQHIIDAVYHQPWNITKPGWLSIHNLLLPHIQSAEMKLPDAKNGSPLEDYFGNPIPQMQIVDNKAVIPICGPLIHHASMMEKKCGAVSYDDIIENVQMADANPRVEKIAFHVASPGGMAIGMLEAATVIAKAKKKTYAYTDEMIGSAAYGLVASCEMIASSRSAVTGSIGSMIAVLDMSGYYEQLGLKVHLFASGKFKGAGTNGVELTEDHKAYFESIKDSFASQFLGHVQEHRSQIPLEAMQGQVFIGESAQDNTNAQKNGIIDGCFDSFNEFLQWI